MAQRGPERETRLDFDPTEGTGAKGTFDRATQIATLAEAVWAHRPVRDVVRARRRAEVGPEVWSVALREAAPLDQAAFEADRLAEMVDQSRFGLARQMPHFAVASGLWFWQALMLLILPLMLAIVLTMAPRLTLAILLSLTTLFFFAIVLVRVVAVVMLTLPARESQRHRKRRLQQGPALPTYSVLVPLYDEAEIVADTVQALAALRYPLDRLDVVLICEADDVRTLATLAVTDLPAHFRIVQVPPAAPRTKPKALNFALQTVRADYVVIYDAEDVPAPDQLQIAADVFARRGAGLGCLQARLNTYNRNDGWLSGQFTLEYSALFDGLLPTLQTLRLPIPLGGTSNHFPRQVLLRAGAWDAFNVTEDADLGVRLGRLGYGIEVLPSSTLEEAPARLSPWLKQRTRWILGWLQTYGVHSRQPLTTFKQLGAWGFIGFHLLAGGLIATVFLHPIVYVMLGLELMEPRPFGGTALEMAIWMIAGINFIAGTLSAMGLAAAAAAGRGQWGLLWLVPTMPLYWLLTSLAAYRAAAQLIGGLKTPLVWEKTAHRARRRGDASR